MLRGNAGQHWVEGRLELRPSDLSILCHNLWSPADVASVKHANARTFTLQFYCAAYRETRAPTTTRTLRFISNPVVFFCPVSYTASSHISLLLVQYL